MLWSSIAFTALAGWIVGHVAPLLGPGAAALVIGTAFRTAMPSRSAMFASSAAIGARVLQASVVALGVSVSAVDVLTVARDSMPVMLATVFAGMAWTMNAGRVLRVKRNTRSLLAVGTSICGASAIAAAAPVLGATAAEVGYAVSVVFVFNFVAVLTFPAFAHALGMSAAGFSVWAGTAINDTSSVLAAALAFGPAVGAYAAVVKLSRTMMILPTTLLLGFLTHRDMTDADKRLAPLLKRAVPWFAVAFVLGAIANSAGLVPGQLAEAPSRLATAGSVVALAAIGLSTDVRDVWRSGARPLLLAGSGWLLIAIVSLLMQWVTGLSG